MINISRNVFVCASASRIEFDRENFQLENSTCNLHKRHKQTSYKFSQFFDGIWQTFDLYDLASVHRLKGMKHPTHSRQFNRIRFLCVDDVRIFQFKSI